MQENLKKKLPMQEARTEKYRIVIFDIKQQIIEEEEEGIGRG